MKVLKELEFIDKIADNFPFDNYIESVKLIDEAISISPNSVFAVIEEICKTAGQEIISDEGLINLLKAIDKKFDHPLRKVILETAQDIILEETINLDNAIANMELVRKYPQLYSALNILFFSASDIDKKAFKVWTSITTEWNDGDFLFEED